MLKWLSRCTHSIRVGHNPQGNFSGWLESTSNPAWDGVSRTVCVLPVAAIARAPPPLGNSSMATFTFSSSDRAQSLAASLHAILDGAHAPSKRACVHDIIVMQGRC